MVATIIAVGCAPERDEATGGLSESGTEVRDLQVGDCLADFEEATQASGVQPAPCSEPHSDEIYAAGSIDGFDEFPGSDAIEAAARRICLAEYEAFVGRSYQDSVLDISYLVPTEHSWADDDRQVLCTIFDPLDEVTGSLRGAER
jgi:Septum formation